MIKESEPRFAGLVLQKLWCFLPGRLKPTNPNYLWATTRFPSHTRSLPEEWKCSGRLLSPIQLHSFRFSLHHKQWYAMKASLVTGITG